MNRTVRLWVVLVSVGAMLCAHFISRSVDRRQEREAWEMEAVHAKAAKLVPTESGEVKLAWLEREEK